MSIPKYKQYTKQQIQNYINNANSFEDILIQMNYKHPNDKRITELVKEYCESLSLDISNLLLKKSEAFIVCNRCNKRLPKNEFYLRKDGCLAQKVCKECVREKERIKYHSYQEKLNEYKKNHPCMKCGCNKFYLIDFHHINPSEKEYNISDNSHAKFETLLKEIEKCIPLCSNCHREFHYLNEHNGITLEQYLHAE